MSSGEPGGISFSVMMVQVEEVACGRLYVVWKQRAWQAGAAVGSCRADLVCVAECSPECLMRGSILTLS